MSTLTFSLVQTSIHWENKNANLSMLEHKIDGIADKTEIVVLPEMFSTGFSMKAGELAETMDGPSVEWMRTMAQKNNIILAGSLIIAHADKYYNRLIWMLPNGQSGHYDKRHLFGFAGENNHYTAGIKRLIASVKGWKINVQVCYDLRFPVWARQQQAADEMAMPEYDVLIYVANWPARRSHAWKTLLCARAIENQCYVIGVNRVGNDGNDQHYSGDSMLIDPLGEVLYHKEEEEDICTIAIDKDHLDQVRSKLPFLRDRDHFVISPDKK